MDEHNYKPISICIIIVVIILTYYILPIINNTFLFHPTQLSEQEASYFLQQYKDNILEFKFKTKDKLKLHGVLVNSNRKPSWDDIIFLFSHGNNGWLGIHIDNGIVNMLSKYGSVFIYDYREYGINSGLLSEQGLYLDIKGAYNYLIKHKKIKPSNIIIFGHSLGCVPSTKLVADIIDQNKNSSLPKALILDSPFSSLKDIATDYFPVLSHIVVYNMNNYENLKKINNAIPICIYHSPYDFLIPVKHAIKLSNTGCELCYRKGDHGLEMIFEDDTFIKNLI